MAEKMSMTPTTQREGQVTRRMPAQWSASPFGTLQRFTDEIDRIFGDFGFGRRSPGSPLSRSAGAELWAPEIDVFQRNNELVVKADLPGLKKDEVKIDITDDAITIQGERRSEHEEEREGVYRSERSYGSFCRVVPLPEGAMTDQAKATFNNGVLEITMPAPPEQVTRGRRLEISEGTKK
jgi:HSP20 family protein